MAQRKWTQKNKKVRKRKSTNHLFVNVKEAGATTRRDSPFQGTLKVNPEYLESLI